MNKVYGYILVMALTTYLIRALPLLFIHGKIKNRYVRSFLYYVPYATLAAMAFPAVLTATGHLYSSAAGFTFAVLAACKRQSLVKVAVVACAAALAAELLMRLAFS